MDFDTKDTDKTFDELAVQLRLLERNLIKSVNKSGEKFTKDALALSAGSNKPRKSAKKEEKRDCSCNYYHKVGHSVR